MTRASPYIVLILLGGMWGSAFLFIEVLLNDTTPTAIALGRMFFGAITILIIGRFNYSRPRITASLVAKLALLAILSSVIPFILIPWAQQSLDSGEASVLVSSMPLFTAIFAALSFSDEKLTGKRIAGLLTGFGGVTVIAGSDALALAGAGIAGIVAVLGASASYAVATIYVRVLLRSGNATHLTGMHLAIASILMLPVAFIFDGVPDYRLGGEAWLSLIALGAISTGVAYAAYFWLVGSIGSVRASLVTYIVPIVGLSLGWTVLGEEIHVHYLAGISLILIGVTAVMGHPVRKSPQSHPPLSNGVTR